MSKIVKPLSLAVGAAFIGSMSLSQIALADTGFQLNQMKSGYNLADQAAAPADAAKAKEGKCGEGKCGATKGKKCMDMTDKAAQDKCMADAHKKGADKSCSGDKKGADKSCSGDKKGGEKSCSGDKKGAEKSCSGDKKGAEKSCSGDKKGSEKSCSGGH
jgi:uncharacterized low-complexity protein